MVEIGFLDLQNNTALAYLDEELIMRAEIAPLPSEHGFVVFGPETFGVAHFDNLVLSRAENRQERAYLAELESRRKMRGPLLEEIPLNRRS